MVRVSPFRGRLQAPTCRLIVGPVFGPISAQRSAPAHEEPHYQAVSPVSPAQSRRLNRTPSRSAPVRVIRWLNCRGGRHLPARRRREPEAAALLPVHGRSRVPARVPDPRESGSPYRRRTMTATSLTSSAVTSSRSPGRRMSPLTLSTVTCDGRRRSERSPACPCSQLRGWCAATRPRRCAASRAGSRSSR